MMRILKKHKGFLIVLLILLLAFGVYRVYSWIQGEPREDLLYTQEYIPGTRNIKGDVDIEKWEALGEEFPSVQIKKVMRYSRILGKR